jgi:hypothetical protein
MSTVVYAIVFSGGIVDGFQPISVKAHMAKMLKADVNTMAKLFSGKPIVLKRTTDKQLALKYGTALKKVGADVRIKAVKTNAPPPARKRPAPQAAADTSPVPDTSGLSLMPLEGNLVEPSPPPPPPSVDLSGFEVLENDGSPIIEPSPVEILELDLSEYSVRDADGSPLVEPASEPVPHVDAPDFGLDEPGAVLDTIKEDKELVNPDISGLTLAEPGSDLLTPDDKPHEPPPQPPDTSNIQLEPPGDQAN